MSFEDKFGIPTADSFDEGFAKFNSNGVEPKDNSQYAQGWRTAQRLAIGRLATCATKAQNETEGLDYQE